MNEWMIILGWKQKEVENKRTPAREKDLGFGCYSQNSFWWGIFCLKKWMWRWAILSFPWNLNKSYVSQVPSSSPLSSVLFRHWQDGRRIHFFSDEAHIRGSSRRVTVRSRNWIAWISFLQKRWAREKWTPRKTDLVNIPRKWECVSSWQSLSATYKSEISVI